MTVGRWRFCPKHRARWKHVSISFDQNVWTTENNKSHNMLSVWWFSRRDFVPVYVENVPKDSKYVCHKNKVSDVQHKLPLITVATGKHKQVCLLHSIWFPKLKWCGTWKNEWTYLCPDSWAMVKARPSPVSSLIVQLRYLLHIPLIGAKPAERKKQLNMGGRIYLYEWLMHVGNVNQIDCLQRFYNPRGLDGNCDTWFKYH